MRNKKQKDTERNSNSSHSLSVVRHGERLPGPLFYFILGVVWMLCTELIIFLLYRLYA